MSSKLFFGSICVLMCAVLIGSRFLVDAKLSDHKTMFYTLPRPGVGQNEDCYTDMYAQDIKRDVKYMAQLGVTTIMTYNSWNWGASHEVLLQEMANNKMTLGLTFRDNFKENLRRNLERLSKSLEDSKMSLEFVFLDSKRASADPEAFFRWVIELRSFLSQYHLAVPVFVRFFPEITNPSTIGELLKRYDGGDFEAWVVEAYSTESMDWWEAAMGNNQKQLFFRYGADSWDMINKTLALPPQADQLMSMVNRVMNGGNGAISISGAVQGWSDTWFLANEEIYFQGHSDDVCPDQNPFLKTSCGGVDHGIQFGDHYWSVEHMGIMKAFETIWYTRCLETTPAARALQGAWNPAGTPLPKTICVFSNSVPHDYVLYVWAAGGAVAIIGLLLGCCKSRCRDCQRVRTEKKWKKRMNATASP